MGMGDDRANVSMIESFSFSLDGECISVKNQGLK